MTTAPATLTSAEANAKAHAEEIAASHEAWLYCRDQDEGRHLSTEAKVCLSFHRYNGTNHDKVADEIEEACREAALSIDVRSGWDCPSCELVPEEFQILLSTGGPALRITGDLADFQPDRPRIQHQDWGTPWTEWRRDVDHEALNWFCSLFWFGA